MRRDDAAEGHEDERTPGLGAADDAGELPRRENVHALTVVGLGGSAGSIPALEAFFQGLPAGSGPAYVVVLHLAPDHESRLAELLARSTLLSVSQVTGTVRMERDRVYVIPPGKQMEMRDGTLSLRDLDAASGARTAIDTFFRTLADAHGPQATAVVLSGTGADGTLGLRRIKEAGGLTVAQSPAEAEFDAMPRSAIATGQVDYVLPAAAMARQIAAYWETSSRMRLPAEAAPSPEQRLDGDESEAALRGILAHVRAQTGHDFSAYKRATVLRRIGRRLQVNGQESLPAYLDFLRRHPAETGDLVGDLLISVTQFFRDPEAWQALERGVIPRLFQSRGLPAQGEPEPVRAWVCGCATGEEAYSLAILLLEGAARTGSLARLQVFATDMDADAIVAAREGVYPDTIAADVSEERRRRWFHRTEGGRYQVRKEVRETVLFASHDVLRDTPFSRMSLVVCRNLLIYLTPEAQGRVFETFHFALRPEGRLFLGTSESVEAASFLFGPSDKPHRLFVRRPVARPILPVFPGERGLPPAPERPRPALAPLPPPPRPVAGPGELHHSLLELYAPPSALTDERHEVLHLSAGAGRFLRVAGGEPTRDLLRLIRPELRAELRTALFMAASEGQEQVRLAHAVLADSRPAAPVRLTVRPVDAPEGARGYFLVFFQELAAEPAPGDLPPATLTREGAAGVPGPSAAPVVRQLEEENAHLQAQVRATVERYEALTEELKASNEELQAINEELRSAAEELETSKEELQSVNEELTTVNHELKSRVDEATRANGDLQNFLASTNIGTVFLDRALRVRRYTPAAEALFQLIPTDVGRPLSDLTSRLDYPDLWKDAERVLERLETGEREVATADGQRYFLARLLPYRTLDDRIDGVVVNFVDITERKHVEEVLHEIEERKRAEQALRASEERFRTLADSVPQVIWTNNADGEADYFNRRWYGYTGLTYERSAGPGWQAVVHPDDASASVERWQRALAAGTVFDTEYRLRGADGDFRWFLGRNVPLKDATGATVAWFGSATDVEDWKQAQAARQESEERFRLLVEGARDYAMFLLDTEGRITFWSAGAERVLGYTAAEALGQPSALIFTPEDRERGDPERELGKARADGQAADRRWHLRRDGTRFWADGMLMRLDDEGGALRGFAKVMRDATEQWRAEEEARRAMGAVAQANAELEGRVEERTAQWREAAAVRQDLTHRLVGAEEEERRRLSRELHDQTGQHLTGLMLGLDALRAALPAGSEPAALAERLRQSAADLSREVHQLAWDLRPPALDDIGLHQTLFSYVQEWGERNGVAADFFAPDWDGDRLAPEVETALYRAVQEALTNAARHARASRVSVVLERRDRAAVLVVEDDGAGFDAAATLASPPRLGLRGMRERVEMVGGTLEIESAPGGGTTLVVHVPAATEQTATEQTATEQTATEQTATENADA